MDWESRVVRLDPGSTKNRDGRTFPFTAELERTLHEHLVEHDRLKQDGRIVARVFHRDGEPIKDFRDAFASACKAAGCPGRILHDFRRPTVRNLERDGVSRFAAIAMVGHKTESIYRRYAIVDAALSAMLQRRSTAQLRHGSDRKPHEVETCGLGSLFRRKRPAVVLAPLCARSDGIRGLPVD